MLFRPLLGAPFPVPSLSCFIFYTRWSVLRRSRCSKVPVSASLSKGRPDSLISIPDSPLVGPRPLLLLTTFHLFLRGVVFSLWLFVASCGTGWASTPSCNLRPPFHISLLTTKSLRRHSHYAHCQPLQLTYGRASSSQVIYLLVFNICCSLPHFGTLGAFPFGRLTCVLSALPISP